MRDYALIVWGTGGIRSDRRWWAWVLLSIALLLWPTLAVSTNRDAALLVDIEGPIGPATAAHVHSAFEHATSRNARVIVLRMDTPGGLDTAMRDIIRDVLASPVPVIGWVAPSGARAASAGTYILYASHIAAMATATTLGAATPVQIGGLPTPADPKSNDDADDETPGLDHAVERKLVEDARAYIRGLAKLRGRNIEWAERAVVEAASLSAREALDIHVIDLIAENEDELLRRLDGRTVAVLGDTVTLETAGTTLERHDASWRIRLLAVITNPNVAYVLMLLGLYGLFFELANPGFVFPGVVGAICLILALFAFQTLSVNWAGIALIVLGVAFMVGEAFVPSVGALGIGGLIAFIVGSIMLMEIRSDFFDVSLGLILGVAIVSALFFIGVVGLALRSRRADVVSGREQLIGASAMALEAFEELGQVRAHGEIWRARTVAPVDAGQTVRVVAVDGLTLEVEPKPGNSSTSARLPTTNESPVIRPGENHV